MGWSRTIVYGKGINDADYKVTKSEKIGGKWITTYSCPYYTRWANMLKRCYHKSTYHTYNDVTVCDDWLLFSKFKAWMELQDWEGKHLDKDILKRGNKVYCPEYCVFVDQTVNFFILGSGRRSVAGTYYDKNRNKWVAECTNPLTKRKERLGRYINKQDATDAWRKRRNEIAEELAVSEYVTDDRVRNAIFNWYK